MAYKYSFADNEAYGASDINAITKRLVTSGIEDSFTDGVAYNVSNLNEMGKVIYTQGVVPETCLTLKVIAASEGKILINPGIAFFDDGSVIEIEDGGVEMPYVMGEVNYVYLKNDLLNMNVSYPYCGTEAPDGDYVMLAEISESGAITDKRTYAKGKLPGYQSLAGNTILLNDGICLENTTPYKQYSLSGSATFDIGKNSFEYILTYVKSGSQTHPCLGIYDIVNRSYQGFHCVNSSYSASCSTDSLYIYDHNRNARTYTYITFSLDNGKLTVTLTTYDERGFDSGESVLRYFNLILF